MRFKKTKMAKVLSSLSFLSLTIPLGHAAVIDINTITNNEIVLTEDSQLLQESLPTLQSGSTFTIKGKHTLQIGPSPDAYLLLDMYADATFNVEGSLSLITDKALPAGGALHSNQGSVLNIGENLTITGAFKYGGSAIELVGVRDDKTDQGSTLKVGKTLSVHDAIFTGSSGPIAIQLMNSDIFADTIKLEDITRTSTSNGPFYLLGLMGNSSNIVANSINILNVTSDTGIHAIELNLPQSSIDVGNIKLEKLTAKNGSYLGYSAAIISSGSIIANNIDLLDLKSADDLFGVNAFGLVEKNTGQVYLSQFKATSLTITGLTSEENNAVGLLADLAKFDINTISINGVNAKSDAAGMVVTNLTDDSRLGSLTISNISGGTSAVGLQADNVTLAKGVHISNITATGGASAAILAVPTEDNKQGIIISAQANTANSIEGDMITTSNPKDNTVGKISADFSGQASGFKGATILKMDKTSEAGTINLAFKNKAKWTVTKNSELSALDMQDGVLAVDINLTDGEKDGTTQVNVNGAAQGTFDVALNITVAAAADFTKSEDWFLAQESGTLTVGKVTYQNGGVLAYDVKFFEEGAAPDAQGTSSSTGNKGQWHVVLGQSTPDKPIDPDNPPVTPEAKQVLSLGASVSQGLGMLSESEDLRMRMGEVRNGVSDGLWTRTYARQDGAKGSFGKEFKQDTYGIYLGADRVVAIDDDSSWLLGGAFHYGRSDMEGVADANGGSSDLDQYSIKAYATYMQESGSFADIVLHAGYYDTDITGKTNNGFDAFSAKYHNWGYGISAEVGHRFTVGETAHGWFIEPTAQLTWFHAEGKDFKTTTKLTVSQSDADFITGRLGALIGKTIAYGPANNPMEKYVSFGVKGGLLYQFDGEQSIKMHGTENASVKVDAMDLNGARGYYGVNAEWAANKSWRIYGQISREEGNGYTKDFEVSIGARYEF